jgi:hypothetical protein
VEQEKKVLPLSEKPQGYLLSIAGGIIGGPIGMILSPIVLVLLNNGLRAKEGKVPNRFAIWALAGIVGAPLSWTPFALIDSDTNMGKNQKKEVSATEQIEKNPEAIKQQTAQETKVETFSFTANGYIDRLNSVFSSVDTEELLKAKVIKSETNQDSIITQASVSSSVAYLITSDKKSGKVTDITMIGAGTGSISSGVNILLSMMATIIAIENPEMDKAERNSIAKQLGVEDIEESRKFTRNGVRYSRSFTEGVGLFLTAEKGSM